MMTHTWDRKFVHCTVDVHRLQCSWCDWKHKTRHCIIQASNAMVLNLFVATDRFDCTQNRCGTLHFINAFSIAEKLDLVAFQREQCVQYCVQCIDSPQRIHPTKQNTNKTYVKLQITRFTRGPLESSSQPPGDSRTPG